MFHDSLITKLRQVDDHSKAWVHSEIIHTSILIIQYRNHSYIDKYMYSTMISISIHRVWRYLSETRNREVTVERGAGFHPTIGTATPDGFTVDHPRSRPWCSERDSFFFLNDSQGWRLLSSSHKILEIDFLYTNQGGLHEYFHTHSSALFISL